MLEDGLLDQGQALGVLLGRGGLGRAGLEVVGPLGGDVGTGDGGADLGIGALVLLGHEPGHRADCGGESGALGLAGLQGDGDVEVQGLAPALDHVGLVSLGGAEGEYREAEHGRQVDGALQGGREGGDPVAQPLGQGVHGEDRDVGHGADGQRVGPVGVVGGGRVEHARVEGFGIGKRVLRKSAFEETVVVVLHCDTSSPVLERKMRQRPRREAAICWA